MLRLDSVIIMTLLLGVSPDANCPVLCICYSEESNKSQDFNVVCMHGDMKRIPQFSAKTTTVVIESKKIQSLDGFAFESAPRLKTLRLVTSNLTSVSWQAFEGIQNLSSINIKSEQHVQFNTNRFKHPPQLFHLKLEVGLAALISEVLCGGQSVQGLDLQRNKIVSARMPPCVAQSWKDMRELNLAGNPLKTIQAKDFYYLQNITLKLLGVSQCGITELEVDTFMYLKFLTILDIGDNMISRLPKGIFDHLEYLTDLTLKNMRLPILPLYLDSPVLHTLKQLNVGSCRQMSISFGPEFRDAAKLEVLVLSNVNISSIDDRFFANLASSSLSVLNMQSSKITTISREPYFHLII